MMIHIRPTITAKDFFSEREYKRAMVAAHEAMGHAWHRDILPQHFKPDAAQKYNHRPRTRAYLKRKRRMYERRTRIRPSGKCVQGGGIIDNLFTGAMRDMLTRFGAVRAYPTRTSVTMRGPRYMTMRVFTGDRRRAVREGWRYGRGKRFNATAGTQPDKKKEILATTRDDRERLARAADMALERAAADWIDTTR